MEDVATEAGNSSAPSLLPFQDGIAAAGLFGLLDGGGGPLQRDEGLLGSALNSSLLFPNLQPFFSGPGQGQLDEPNNGGPLIQLGQQLQQARELAREQWEQRGIWDGGLLSRSSTGAEGEDQADQDDALRIVGGSKVQQRDRYGTFLLR